MNTGFTKLDDGSRIAIIGGGPAGVFFALYLQRYATEKGIHPDITIYEQRSFDERGPKGCKGCAGILSVTFLRNLKELGLTIPNEVIQTKIDHYAVHSPDVMVSLSNPEKEPQVVSVYRGGGPRLPSLEKLVSFDGWLLKEAQLRGVKSERQRVTRIWVKPETGIEVAGEKVDYDMVVLAAGVNAGRIPIAGLTYLPPATHLMAQDELYAGFDQVQSRLGNVAHAFLIPHSDIIFGTLVPKGPFINVSVLGKGARTPSVKDFLNYETVRSILPDTLEPVCGCCPRAVVGLARHYYADGFFAIGDASISRLYKDGIGSALLTAREAARTVVWYGASHADFDRYYKPFCDAIAADNRWGKLLFSLTGKVKDSRVFLLTQHRLIGDEQSNVRGPQPFTKAAWGVFTGNYRYRSIAGMVLAPASLMKLLGSFIREGLRTIFSKRQAGLRELYVRHRKVLILGSGFGGTYTLRALVRSLNRNENIDITMVSNENYFLFAPLLHEVAMGRIETRHIAYPIRRLNMRDRFSFVQATIKRIDLNARKVDTSAGNFDFEYLVLALGNVTDMSGIEFSGNNVFTLKTLRDALLLRNHIIGVFEKANIEKDPQRQSQLFTFVVSGASYTGVQLATEMSDFIHRTLLRFYKELSPQNIRIVLLEAEAKIVPDLHPKLGAYAMKQLRRKGIEVRLKSRVTGITKEFVEINGIEKVPTSTLIWVVGGVANPRIAELDVKKDSVGRVFVNTNLEIPGCIGVYVLGDCARFEDPKSGQPLPPRAHVAVRQAKIVAQNILAGIRGRDKRAYEYSEPPAMITLGASKAVLRWGGLRLYGFLARFIWLVGYSFLVTGKYNRIRILMDWALSSIFGRDTTYLNLEDNLDEINPTLTPLHKR